jgi:proline dehydrogenase
MHQPSTQNTGTTPDLQDTRTAFAARSDRELWQAAWLFRIIGTPWLSAVGVACTKVALALHLPVKGLIKATIFKQLGTAAKLKASGIGTILDHSVEGQDEEAELDATVRETLKNIVVSKERSDIPFCVFKPTGISRTELLEIVSSGRELSSAEATEWARVEARMETLCAAAHKADAPLMVDAEESYNKERPLIYNTVQLYRHDRLAYLKAAHARALSGGYQVGMKLVRGAYMEKERDRAEEKGYPSPIHADKDGTDRDYDAAVSYCFEHRDRIAFMAGSHNETSNLLLARLMNEHGVAHHDPRIHFAQLYGMSDHISYNLSAAGYNVAKYVPYGPVREVMPYLIRRAAENTSVKGQTGRELSLIQAERKRRKRA